MLTADKAHLISGKNGKYGAEACSGNRGKLASAGGTLVEMVGEVTCRKCQKAVISMYGRRALHLYPNLDKTSNEVSDD